MTRHYQKYAFFLFAAFSLLAFLLIRYYAEKNETEKNAAAQIRFENADGMAVSLQTAEGGEENAYYSFLPSGFVDVKVDLPDAWELSIAGQSMHNGSELVRIGEAAPVSLLVTGQGGKVLLEGTYTEYVADGTESLFLNVRRGTLSAVHADPEKKTSLRAVYETMDADGSIGRSGTCALSGHGNLTWRLGTADKKPYSLELDRAASLFGMGSQTEWVLLSCYFDKTMLMNRMAYESARLLDRPFTPELTMVNLYIDGEYRGLYQLVQKTGADGGTFTRDGVDPAWLAEFDFYDAAKPGTDFRTQLKHVIVKHPKTLTTAMLDEIRSEISAAENYLLSRDEHYAECLDVPSFVREFLLAEIYMEKDVDFSSQFIYRLRDNERIYAGPAWDYDQLLGTINWGLDYGGLETRILWIPGMTSGQEVESGWLKELWEIPSFRSELKTCYTESFDAILTEMIQTTLPAWEAEIESSVTMDSVRWGTGNADFYSAMERSIRWLTERQGFFRELWMQDEDLVTVTFVTRELEDNGHDLLYLIRRGEQLPSLPSAEGVTGWVDEEGQPVCIGNPVTQDRTVLPVRE